MLRCGASSTLAWTRSVTEHDRGVGETRRGGAGAARRRRASPAAPGAARGWPPRRRSPGSRPRPSDPPARPARRASRARRRSGGAGRCSARGTTAAARHAAGSSVSMRGWRACIAAVQRRADERRARIRPRAPARPARLSFSTSASVTAGSQCWLGLRSASAPRGASSGCCGDTTGPVDDDLGAGIVGSRAASGGHGCVASTRRRPTPGGATAGRACARGSRSCPPPPVREAPGVVDGQLDHVERDRRRRSSSAVPHAGASVVVGVSPRPGLRAGQERRHDAGDVAPCGRRGAAGRRAGARLCAALLSLSRRSSVGSVSAVAGLGAHHLRVRPRPGVAERLQLVAADLRRAGSRRAARPTRCGAARRRPG